LLERHGSADAGGESARSGTAGKAAERWGGGVVDDDSGKLEKGSRVWKEEGGCGGVGGKNSGVEERAGGEAGLDLGAAAL
jgi:hypothetical protein